MDYRIDKIKQIIDRWERERGGIGFASFQTYYDQQSAFTKADWTALTEIKVIVSLNSASHSET